MADRFVKERRFRFSWDDRRSALAALEQRGALAHVEAGHLSRTVTCGALGFEDSSGGLFGLIRLGEQRSEPSYNTRCQPDPG
jgi:hypothetical protein